MNYHLNQGSSYSASYIARSLAFTKHLKQQYDLTAVVGLSQGGKAAFLNAMQSKPDFAVIASGYSTISEKVEGAGHNQIIIHGVSAFYNSEYVFEQIRAQDSQWFFSYGYQEQGLYRLEVTEQLTCMLFAPLDNVKCILHDKDHVFPVEDIDMFFNETLRSNTAVY